MDFEEWGEVIFRSVTSLIFLFFVTKMLGKKQVSQLSIFDYVIGISMGSIAAEMTLNIKSAYINGFTSMAIYAAIAYIVSLMSLKSIVFRRFVSGTPIVLIEKGKIVRTALRKSLIDINDLLEECRSCGYFDISEIEYAIMETSGKISFLPKTDYAEVVNKDLNIKAPYKGLCANVILDGSIMINNLKDTGKSKDWLLREIKKQGYKTLDKIILATVDASGKLIIYEYIKHSKPHTSLE